MILIIYKQFYSGESNKMHDDIFRSMPKEDLHVHLNGAVKTDLVKELLKPIVAELPEDFDLESDLQVLKPVKSLQEYFRPWHGLKKLPRGRDCLQKMMSGALSFLKKDNITYVELRNSPFNIANLNGISLQEALEWMIDTLKGASIHTGISARLIPSISRYKFNINAAYELLYAIKAINQERYIVGLDLSGDEDTQIVDDVSKVFIKAKEELGLGVTIHAGETGNLKNIEWAINSCKADRIAHGLAASKSPKIMETLRERDICLEICLNSNFRTGSVKDLNVHPIGNFLRFGVPFILCSDNPAINSTLLSDDYILFERITGRYDILCSMKTRQSRYSFRR